jgi:UDP-glucuronate 4-epimerase
VGCAAQSFGYEIFNLGGSSPVTLSRLIELLENALQKRAIIKRLPNQPGDVPRTFADVTKAGKLLGYAPKVGIEDGIARFVAWLKHQA